MLTVAALVPLSFVVSSVGTRAPLRASAARLDLGFQIDAGATAGSVFVLGGFVALQLRIRSAEAWRDRRDAAVEALRVTQSALLAGTASSDDVRRAAEAALSAAAGYDDARQVLRVPGALLRIPDPTAEQARRLLAPYDPSIEQAQPAGPTAAGGGVGTGRGQGDQLEGVRRALGLRDTVGQGKGSLLPSGGESVTLKDVAIGFVLLLQIGWCEAYQRTGSRGGCKYIG
jgi:hypothetical protein